MCKRARSVQSSLQQWCVLERMEFVHPEYEIEKELGRGGSATVYLARQKKLDRQVALKVMHGTLTTDAALTERFVREARIVAKLSHKNILPVFDVGEDPGGAGVFIAMEYLPGGSLQDRYPLLKVSELLEVLLQVTEALAFAHERGFVHRDVKPENILFRSPKEVLLADFGIARSTEPVTQMTQTGTLLGTPDYMSPEQLNGSGELDGRSDLYSLGIMFFEMLAGVRPFRGDTFVRTAMMHLTHEVPDLPEVSRRFAPCVHTLLAKDAAERYSDAGALRQELRALQSALPASEDVPLRTLHQSGGVSQRQAAATTLIPGQKPRRRYWPAALAAAVTVSVAAGLWFNSLDTQPVETVTNESTESDLPEIAGTGGVTSEPLSEQPSPVNVGADDTGNVAEGLPSPDSATTQSSAVEEAETSDVASADDGPAPVAVAPPPRIDPLQALLTAARTHERNGRLLNPAEDNAWLKISEALALEPDNRSALDLRDDVVRQLANRARRDDDAAATVVEDIGRLAVPGAQLAAIVTEVEERRVQQQMNARIAEVSQKMTGWLNDPEPSLGDELLAMESEVKTLVDQSPAAQSDNLQMLLTMVQTRAQQMQADALAQEEDDQFRTPAF